MLQATKRIKPGGQELQDRAEFLLAENDLAIVLADGAGGMSGGAEAAEFVIQKFKAARDSASLKFEAMPDFLAAMDREMAEAQAVGEATCVILFLQGEKIFGASVGDSGAWMISDAGIEDLTANQCRRPLLGSGGALPVPFKYPKLSGTLLVASDGLLKYTSQEKIAAASRIADIDAAAEELLGLVRYPSGVCPDDVSLILVRNK